MINKEKNKRIKDKKKVKKIKRFIRIDFNFGELLKDKKYKDKILFLNKENFENETINLSNLKGNIMAVSLNCMNWANDYGSQLKIKYFMQKAAVAVLGEEAPIGEEHVARVAFAKTILSGQASIYEFTIGVVTNATIATIINGGSQPPDNDLEFAVNSMFSDFSGWDQ